MPWEILGEAVLADAASFGNEQAEKAVGLAPGLFSVFFLSYSKFIYIFDLFGFV